MIKLPFSCLPLWNRYVVVFMDYLTKWPEAYATSDQTAKTNSTFVEQIVCHHGIPQELLSDRGQNFLSTLMQEVCRLLQVKKLNTSGYHPQTDGLVEKFNSTLIEMIAKCASDKPLDWDTRLPYLLFAYRSSAQESTCESSFIWSMVETLGFPHPQYCRRSKVFTVLT